ncbi:MAG: 16S rRNA (cytidine(1402)-2'-O)-methyltransferase [Gammaproteobacteria bacterium]|nr:16S rRNA (cytidine(1402)-2'-O)-methyltransferase [Gammaproteobacteria bacterium]MDP6615592.1 16S rRNA (cytidine(1402)-2'-O)-methyltransferase [Gammaproteobacteria bacterium]MDP6694734.1 16S rRNA (cytidine(1402)-2'-O)-methyltransferase [Gammaproteobacteria bacterium]MDP7042146.1 16S rRNA (cytidine(1402)-2'-O)-methyltransferase [Gammaproteobacteria bacterium]
MSTGTLYIVATPIGNIDDISPRARTVLAGVDLVAAEDTRHTGRLLKHLGIKTRMISCHEHNEARRSAQILEQISAGGDVALVSNAGTPLLSDPGFQIVRAAADAGLCVSPVPGCSAAIAALSIAGLPTDSFSFAGFLPSSAAKRRARLQELAAYPATLILYESVHRIGATLDDIAGALGDSRQMVAARELTKLHETVYRGTVAQVAEQIAADPGGAKGEYTLVIAGAGAGSPAADSDSAGLDRTLRVLLGYLSVREAAEATAKILDVRRNEAYERALKLRESGDKE